MNQPQPAFQLPRVPKLANGTDFHSLQGAIKTAQQWMNQHTLYLQDYMGKIQQQVNSQVQSVGAALVSGATITISAPTHHITGTGTITMINPPSGFSGPIWLIADAGFSVNTGGNIAAAVNVTINKHLCLVFDPTTALWYPSI